MFNQVSTVVLPQIGLVLESIMFMYPKKVLLNNLLIQLMEIDICLTIKFKLIMNSNQTYSQVQYSKIGQFARLKMYIKTDLAAAYPQLLIQKVDSILFRNSLTLLIHNRIMASRMDSLKQVIWKHPELLEMEKHLNHIQEPLLKVAVLQE